MEKTEEGKLEIMLKYWVDHNKEHLEDMENWRKKAEELGLGEVKGDISNAYLQMRKANEYLAQALEKIRRRK